MVGERDEIPRISECLLNLLAGFLVDLEDTGMGYRALEKNIVIKDGASRDLSL